jgi:hypothetical protein
MWCKYVVICVNGTCYKVTSGPSAAQYKSIFNKQVVVFSWCHAAFLQNEYVRQIRVCLLCLSFPFMICISVVVVSQRKWVSNVLMGKSLLLIEITDQFQILSILFIVASHLSYCLFKIIFMFFTLHAVYQRLCPL